jgi:hypothetical protein
MLKPELWTKTPIARKVNPLTSMIEGDDKGYRDVRTLPTNPAPLVAPDVTCLAAYDGWTFKGLQDPSIILPGGLRDGALVVRETFARDIEDAEQVFRAIQRNFDNSELLRQLWPKPEHHWYPNREALL